MHKVRFQLEHGDRNVGAIYLPDDLSTTLPVLVVCFGGLSNDQLSPFTQELCLRWPPNRISRGDLRLLRLGGYWRPPECLGLLAFCSEPGGCLHLHKCARTGSCRTD